MSRPVHVEGLGWLGSVAASVLDDLDVEWTWSDLDDPHPAWRASTGMVAPAGDPLSRAGWIGWTDWIADGRFGDLVEPVAWWWTQQAPPHGDDDPVAVDLGWCRRSDRTAYAVDVAAIVRGTRDRHADRRVERCPDGARRLVAHGFGRRLGARVWGWSAPARLDWPDDVVELSDGLTPVLYARRARMLTYAFWTPSARLWTVGSAMVRQTTPRELDVDRHVALWLSNLDAIDVPLVAEVVGPGRQGWRPAPDGPADVTVVVDSDGTAHVPSLGHSGVKWSPLVAEQLHRWIVA